MLESLITNKTRLKLLLKFFLNKETTSYLRNLEHEFGESSNAIRVELNRLEKADLLVSNFNGNRKYFRANGNHPLYTEINSILQKTVGLDTVIDKILKNVGDLNEAYLVGDLAIGKESSIIDLLLVGDDIDTRFVVALVSKAEKLVNKKIRYLVLSEKEKTDYLEKQNALHIWSRE
ncbi:ArsR family transcriptional regulator [Draconibacterium halophilum]|uniref:ArsR family transcriptional regulator n=1 Tax=Draconibacterium halophilum TaxID=2706887 RepID=A0A6C0RHE4_9BACT|nr:ArsR family transcriptional regulator [Draconibacterium halophilum]QIA08511.1 ArsR family transcriptional regulator [Draconibacterium halophilum]